LVAPKKTKPPRKTHKPPLLKETLSSYEVSFLVLYSLKYDRKRYAS